MKKVASRVALGVAVLLFGVSAAGTFLDTASGSEAGAARQDYNVDAIAGAGFLVAAFALWPPKAETAEEEKPAFGDGLSLRN